MSYIHKVTMYFIDPNEDYFSAGDIVEDINNSDNYPRCKLVDGVTKKFE